MGGRTGGAVQGVGEGGSVSAVSVVTLIVAAQSTKILSKGSPDKLKNVLSLTLAKE